MITMLSGLRELPRWMFALYQVPF